MNTLENAVRVAQAAGLELVDAPEGLTLTDGKLKLRADFRRMLSRLKPGRLKAELLVRAAHMRGVDAPVAIDATAGFGEDSLLLAAAGFTCELYERDPVVAALLADALVRALHDPDLAPYAERMSLVPGDSLEGMRVHAEAGETVDVVYLDPMFPERTKSAAVKKKFQLLHRLERPCDDEEELLETARACSPKKIVIKRPAKGPLLAGACPSYQIKGKAVRYDVLVSAGAV